MDNGASSYRRYLEGDDNGLVEIIRDYKDGLILWLYEYTHDYHTAEELCEDTFVKIAVNKPHFRENSSFKTFLYAVGRNLALDMLRKRRDTLPLEDITELSDGENIEQNYLREERRVAVHKALGVLKAEYRQVLWLTYFEGLSNKESAKIMGKTVHGTQALLSRARKAMRAVLEEAHFDNS